MPPTYESLVSITSSPTCLPPRASHMGLTASCTQTDPLTSSTTLKSDHSTSSSPHRHSAPDLLALHDPPALPSLPNVSSSRTNGTRPSSSLPDSLDLSHPLDIPPSSPPLSHASPESSQSDDPPLVPTLFTWPFDAKSVFVSGAWDAWTGKNPLFKNGNEFIALLYLPVGDFDFKFLVDDNWQCAPKLPTSIDCHGNTNNVISVVQTEPEFDCPIPLHAPTPCSPPSSYGQHTAPDFSSSDPPCLPPHLEARTLKPLPEDISPSVTVAVAAAHQSSSLVSPHTPRTPRPAFPGTDRVVETNSNRLYRPYFSHVFIDHLYQTRPTTFDDDEVDSLSQTCRVGSKVINTVIIMSRPRSSSTS